MPLDTTVKFFQNTMNGAPSLSGEADKLLGVLDACLVNGFGSVTLSSLVVVSGVATATQSTGHYFVERAVVLIAGATPSGLNGEKRITWVSATVFTFDATGISDQTATGTITAKMAPAGWEKVYTDPHRVVYRPTFAFSLRGYCRVDDSTTTYATMVGYEPGSMTDINTGTAFSTKYLLKSSSANATARNWFVMADTGLLLVFVESASDNYFRSFAFGDFLTAHVDSNALLMSGGSDSGGDSNGLAVGSENNSYYTNNVAGKITLQRSYLGGGGGVNGSFFAPGIQYYFGRALSTAETYPSPVDSRVHLDALAVYQGAAAAGGVYRGVLPGVYSPRHYVPNGATLGKQLFNADNRRYLFVATGKGNTDSGAGLIVVALVGPWR